MQLLATLFVLLFSQSESRPVVLAFGDSITAGFGVSAESSYPSQLQRELDKRGYAYRVVNQGVSGATTVEGLGRLQRALALQPEIVIIELGGNDVEYRIPANVTRENLRKMIQRFRAGGTTVFLAGRGGETGTLQAELAKEEHVGFIGAFLEGVAGHRELLLNDGRHPTGDGYAIVVQNVLKTIEPVIQEKLCRVKGASGCKD
jgi:acyl-CoA thioesterase-1